jgi:hypothetical protein
MTDAPKKLWFKRPSKKKIEEVQEAPAFLEEPKPKKEIKKTERDYKRPSLEMLKTPCIHCGKTDLVTIKTYDPIKVCHRANGKTFNTLVRRLAKCKSCGKHNSINGYEIR